MFGGGVFLKIVLKKHETFDIRGGGWLESESLGILCLGTA